MYPHTIRLRGPWELELREGDGWSASDRIMLPHDWHLVSGAFRLSRSFGLPRVLDYYEHVWLCVAAPSPGLAWTLNNEPLDFASEVDITQHLASRNRLCAQGSPNSAASHPWHEVALQIRGPFFLRNCRLGGRAILGEAVGSTGVQLELYARWQDQNIGYQLVQAAPDGQAFSFALPATLPDGQPCRVDGAGILELIEGANRWYSCDVVPVDGGVR